MSDSMPLSNTNALLLIAGAALFFLAMWRLLQWLRDRRILSRIGSRARVYYEAPKSRQWRSALTARFPRAWPFIERRFDPHRFKGLPLTLFVLAAVYIAFLFVGLVDEVMESEEVDAFDDFVNAIVAPLRNDMLVRFLTRLTELGSTTTLAAVAIVATGFVWARGPVRGIPALWTCVIGSQITTWSGKFLVDRTRPEFIFDVTAASPSFPSGHATGAMAVYGMISYLISRDLPSRRRRLDVIYWTIVLILAIAFSRVYLSVHYPSDIAAGLLVGGFWVLVGIVVAELFRDDGKQGA